MKNAGKAFGFGKDEDLITKIKQSDKVSGKDYSGKNIRNSDFSLKNFSKTSFVGANLSGCNLRGCDLRNADLTTTNLNAALLKSADLTGAIRNGYQILEYACIAVRDNYYYGFLCQGKGKKVILINEPDKDEYEFQMGKASYFGNLLYNILTKA